MRRYIDMLKGIPIRARKSLRLRKQQRLNGAKSTLSDSYVNNFEIKLNDIAINLQELLTEDTECVTSDTAFNNIQTLAVLIDDENLNQLVENLATARENLRTCVGICSNLIIQYDTYKHVSRVSSKEMSSTVTFSVSSYLKELKDYINGMIYGYGSDNKVVGNGIIGVIDELASLVDYPEVPEDQLKRIAFYFNASKASLRDAFKEISNIASGYNLNID